MSDATEVLRRMTIHLENHRDPTQLHKRVSHCSYCTRLLNEANAIFRGPGMAR